jgi:hypothetical protein
MSQGIASMAPAMPTMAALRKVQAVDVARENCPDLLDNFKAAANHL